MKISRRRTFCTAATLAVLGLLAGAPAAQEQFPLTQAIPDDVFLVTAERHTPEREFLDAYWAEVWQVFREAGIVEEVFGLAIGQADPEVQAQVERVVARFQELFAAIDWTTLGEGEIVFAERLRPPIIVGNDFMGGPPDMAFLVRVDEDVAEETFVGLRAIMDAVTEEIVGVGGPPMAIVRDTTHGTSRVRLNLLQAVPEAPALDLTVGRRADVLLITFGRGIEEDVVRLLDGEGRSIAATPRYEKAFAALPTDLEKFEYVDLVNLHDDMEDMIGVILRKVEAELPAGDRIENAVREGEVWQLTREGLAAYNEGRLEEALELTLKAHQIDPTDTIAMFNLACLHSLLGHNDASLEFLEKAVLGGFHAPAQIAADADLDAIRSDPRYERVLELASMEARSASRAPIVAGRAVLARLIGMMEMSECAATVYRTKGHATYAQSVSFLAENAAENPLYPVVAGRRPVEDFARYLPLETTSFSVSAGIDPLALHDFLEETVATAGEYGTEILQTWQGIQERLGFDLRTDVFGWIDGETVQVSFSLDGKDAWVWRMRVTDDELAREKMAFVLEVVPAKIAELAQQNPMLAMAQPRVQPNSHPELTGFNDVAVGMMPQPIVCGVHDGWMILGSSAEAILLTERTAAGEHPNVRKNEALAERAFFPEGPALSVTFTDHSGDAEEMAAVLTGLSMAGGMIAAAAPEPEAREALNRIFGIVAKLPPIVQAIDFYDSSASVGTFEGDAWHGRSVTRYVPPPPPPSTEN